MEYGSIEREIHVQASPEVAFAVVSRPEHLREWWPDDASGEAGGRRPGRADLARPGDRPDGVRRLHRGRGRRAAPILLPLVLPRRRDARRGDSLLVTFELVPVGERHPIRLTESGFREMGWEVAVLEEHYRDHVAGWDLFVPRLGAYVARLVSAR